MVLGADWMQESNTALHLEHNRLFRKSEGRTRSPSGEGIEDSEWAPGANTPDDVTSLLRSCNPYRLTLAH